MEIDELKTFLKERIFRTTNFRFLTKTQQTKTPTLYEPKKEILPDGFRFAFIWKPQKKETEENARGTKWFQFTSNYEKTCKLLDWHHQKKMKTAFYRLILTKVRIEWPSETYVLYTTHYMVPSRHSVHVRSSNTLSLDSFVFQF